MVHLGNNIAKLRGFRRLPQKDVANRLQLSQQEYSRIEGKEKIEDDLLERIAAIIDFPVDLIKDLDNNSIQTIHNSGSITDSVFYQHNPIDKIVELYDDKIAMLERLLQSEKDKYKKLEMLVKKNNPAS